jgi:DNA-binding response OmpR family regulator
MTNSNSDIRILVVDDEPDILFATIRVLKKEGYEVLGAETGNGCLEKAFTENPDLILLDIQLPDILGTEICLKLKNHPDQQKLYIMMMSGTKTSSDDQADGLDAGADGYITRPISNRELVSRVQSMVRLIRVERKSADYILELEQAMKKIKVLSGIVPICMHCKQIRDDKGYWNQLEAFIANHSDAQFSHCICEDCLKKHHPDEEL